MSSGRKFPADWQNPNDRGALGLEGIGLYLDSRAYVRVQAKQIPRVVLDAHVAVTKFGRWYSIPRQDLWSKQMFSLLMILLQIVEDDAGTVGPMITVGTG